MGLQGGGATWYGIGGRGYHGTLTNMDPAADWITTEKGHALDFNTGSSEAVIVPYAEPLILYNTDYTVQVWLDLEATNAAWTGIIGSGDVSTIQWYIQRNSTGPDARVYHDTTRATLTNLWGALDGAGWVLLTVTYRLSDKYIEAWINGSVYTTATHTVAVPTNQKQVVIGAARELTSINGRIGMAALYNRILRPSEIQTVSQYPNALVIPRQRVYPAVTAGATFGGPTTYHLGADVTPRTVLTLRPA